MKNILLFAGTTEGRLLAEFLIHQPVRLHTAVATAYGASLLPSTPSMTVSSHRMNEAQMIDFIQQQHFDLVLLPILMRQRPLPISPAHVPGLKCLTCGFSGTAKHPPTLPPILSIRLKFLLIQRQKLWIA